MEVFGMRKQKGWGAKRYQKKNFTANFKYPMLESIQILCDKM